MGSSTVVPTMTGWARVQECRAAGTEEEAAAMEAQGSGHLGSEYGGVWFNASVNRYLKVALKKEN